MKRLLVLLAVPLMLAAVPVPSGDLIGPESAEYGETVEFTYTVDDVKKQGKVHVTVVCLQGETVVYQNSVEPFTLADQGSPYISWDGGPADCIAVLVYRISHGSNLEITYLDTETFPVSGIDLPTP